MARAKEAVVTARLDETIYGNLEKVAQDRGLRGPNGLTRAVMEEVGASPDGMTPRERRNMELINRLLAELMDVREELTRLRGELDEAKVIQSQTFRESARHTIMLEALCDALLPAELCEQVLLHADNPQAPENLLLYRASAENGNGNRAEDETIPARKPSRVERLIGANGVTHGDQVQ